MERERDVFSSHFTHLLTILILLLLLHTTKRLIQEKEKRLRRLFTTYPTYIVEYPVDKRLEHPPV